MYAYVIQLLSDSNSRKFIFGYPVHLEGVRVKFVYEGHRVTVKVTRAKARKSLFPQRKTSIGNNSGSVEGRPPAVCVQHGVCGYGGSHGVTAIFVK